ncbi:hypothetical protein BDV93DRAFT_603267 [Ceratobasidium sp. AG-I]|nr:hypothetical protein BDV93DRAFT_603267 [Ceratobasidium sp. AG-I]
MPAASRSAGLKVSLACDSCRSRKRKCDGVRPICGQCRANNHACAFNVHVDKRKPPSKSYVLALEARIKTLEARGQVLEQLLLDAAINVPSPESDGVDLSAFLEAGQRSSAEPDEPDEHLPEDNGASIAALLDIGKLRLEVAPSQPDPSQPPGTFTYFGPQSSRFLSGTETPQPGSGVAAREGDAPYGNPHHSTWFPLCSPEEELALLSTFWAWQRIHFPIVLSDAFLSAYNTGKHNCELVTPMLLDMMFAIGSYFGPGKEGGDGQQGERFFVRAESRVIDEINNPRVATVQALLIMAIFQMGHAKTPVAWTLNGMAVALSTRLGLHIDTTSLVEKNIMPQHIQASRDSTFWAVFTLDIIFSTNMGLHPLHSRRSISTLKPRQRSSERDTSAFIPKNRPAPPPSSDTHGGAGNGAPTIENEEIPDAVWFMLCEFMVMVDTMFTEVYAFDAPKRTAVQDCDLITKNMLAIQAFVDDFPRPLRSASAMRGTEPCLVFLHVRVCLYIILLCRPFVGPRRYSAPQGSNLPLSPADIAAERRSRSLAFGHCRTAALRTMDLLRHLPPRSPCFTTPFFIFTASTVLLLSPRDTQAMRAVRTGLACLEALERDGMWVESVIDAKQRIWGLARRWEIGALSSPDAAWHHSGPVHHSNGEQSQQQQQVQGEKAQGHYSSRSGHSHSHSHSHSQSQSQSQSQPQSQNHSQQTQQNQQNQNRSGSEPLSSTHGSPHSSLDLMSGVVPPYSPSNYEQIFMDSNVPIPWATSGGQVEPSLWLMGNTNGSAYQASWDFLLGGPAVVGVGQGDGVGQGVGGGVGVGGSRVLSNVETEELMQELRRGSGAGVSGGR